MKKAAEEFKKKGILIYLKALQVARHSLLGAFVVLFTLQLMVLGLIGSITIGIYLLPYEIETRLLILFFTFIFLFFVPLIILCIALSEKVWFKASGIEL